MTQSKVGWRLEHHFTRRLSLLLAVMQDADSCGGCQASGRADRGDNGEQRRCPSQSFTYTPHTSYSAHIRTFDFHLAAFSQPNSYIKEVELLNNFVWSMVQHFFISAARKILGWYGEWFSAAVGKYEHATVHCRDLLMERDRWHGTPCICKL